MFTAAAFRDISWETRELVPRENTTLFTGQSHLHTQTRGTFRSYGTGLETGGGAITFCETPGFNSSLQIQECHPFPEKRAFIPRAPERCTHNQCVVQTALSFQPLLLLNSPTLRAAISDSNEAGQTPTRVPPVLSAGCKTGTQWEAHLKCEVLFSATASGAVRILLHPLSSRFPELTLLLRFTSPSPAAPPPHGKSQRIQGIVSSHITQLMELREDWLPSPAASPSTGPVRFRSHFQFASSEQQLTVNAWQLQQLRGTACLDTEPSGDISEVRCSKSSTCSPGCPD